MTHTRRIALVTLALTSAFVAPLAQAADYPERPIRMIVPFPPGGGGDTMARLVMTRVAQELGQPLVVENLAGAGGNVGSIGAAKAPAQSLRLALWPMLSTPARVFTPVAIALMVPAESGVCELVL